MNREPLSPSNSCNSNVPLDSPVENFDSNLNSSNVVFQSNLILQQQIQQRALPLPPLPSRVVKKSAVKSNYRNSVSTENTDPLKNETSYESVRSTIRPSSSLTLGEDVQDFAKTNNDSEMHHFMMPSVQISNYDKNCKSPSVESLTDSTTNSSFATPPFSSSPVGEGQGYYSRFAVLMLSSSPDDTISQFPLPEIEPAHQTRARELIIPRKTLKNDFGFSLRRVKTVDRTSGICQLKSVILAETVSSDQNAHEIGLLPGDQLLEVNGISVNDKTREEIVEMVKSSDSSVKIKVRFVKLVRVQSLSTIHIKKTAFSSISIRFM